MTVLPIAPSVPGLGPEWQIPGVGSPGGVDGGTPAVGDSGSGGSFGNVLAQQVGKLSDLQETAATASQSLANGTATDAASVVTAVEKAQLAMQLAGQIRTRAAEAINDVFHTQI